MKESNEYLTSNRYIRYPFADDSTLYGFESIERPVFGCFVDAMIQLTDADAVPSVSGLSFSGHTLSFTLKGKTDVPLTCTRSRTRFPVISGKTDWCWYVFVLSSDGLRDLESLEAADPRLSTLSLDFSPRCVGAPSAELRKIELYEGLQTDPATGRRISLQTALDSLPDRVISGDVGLHEGYNMELAADADEITLSAIPGAGRGTAPCPCPPEEEDSGKRGIWSEDGHVRFFNDTCYDYLTQNQSDDGEGYLRMNAKCKACCTCDMYALLVNGRLVPIKDLVLESKAVLDRTLSKYEDAVRKWNARIETAKADDIVVNMTAIPLDPAGTNIKGDVSGRMSRCGFTVTVRNDSFVDVSVVIEKIVSSGTIFQPTVSYVQNDAPRTLLSGSGTSVTLQPGKSLTLSYFVRSGTYSGRSSRNGFSSTVTVAAYQNGRLIVRKGKTLSS